MISLENAKQLTKIDDELLSLIKTNLAELKFGDDNPIEGFIVQLGELSLCFTELDDTGWDDEGKYQYMNQFYQLVGFNKTKSPYPCESSIVAEYDLCLDLPATRSGSYYSDYYYQFERPSMFKIEIKTVPEVVVPAHEEIVKQYIKKEND